MILPGAMTAVMRDPAFLADANKVGLPIDCAQGKTVETKMKAALNQPEETVTALKKAAGSGG